FVGVIAAALADIRRQWRLTMALQQFHGRPWQLGPKHPRPPGRAIHQCQDQWTRLDDDAFADDQRAFSLTQKRPTTVVRRAEVESFPFAAGALAPAEQAGRHYSRVV